METIKCFTEHNNIRKVIIIFASTIVLAFPLGVYLYSVSILSEFAIFPTASAIVCSYYLLSWMLGDKR